MCRSSAEGGRRCPGTGRSGGGGFAVAPASAGDKPSRRVDGKPETDAGRRFFDLRQSGGYPSHLEGTGKDARIVRDVSPPDSVFAEAAQMLGLEGAEAQEAIGRAKAAFAAGDTGDIPALYKNEEAAARREGYLREMHELDAELEAAHADLRMLGY